MRLEPPSWWYGGGRSAAALALTPVAKLYGAAGELRHRLTRPEIARVPVICVGNFTVGGAGKTPVAIAVARLLARMGRAPGFLTRGYLGSEKGPHLVDPASDTAQRVGDEALLLARAAPTIVSRDRRAGARFFDGLPCDVIVMDDGFQNPSLYKDVSLVVVDGGAAFGNGRVFPAGPLRAPLRRQLDRAGAVLILGGAPECRTALAARITGLPVLKASLRPAPADADALKGRRVLAFSGIGRPAKFFETVMELGAELTQSEPFPDHHAYTELDADKLLSAASRLKADLLTTEKDAARMAGAGGAVAKLREAARVLPVEVTFDDDGEARLAALLQEAALSRLRPGASARAAPESVAGTPPR